MIMEIMFTIEYAWLLYIDIAVILIYLAFFFLGVHRGFLYQIITLIASVASFFVSWRYHELFADYAEIWPRSLTPMQDTLFADILYQKMNQVVWFVLLFLILKLMFAIVSQLFKGLQEVPILRQINGIFGGLLGLVISTIWVLVFSVFLNTPVITNGQMVKEQTLVGLVIQESKKVSAEFGGPENAGEVLNYIYTSAQELDGQDMEIVSQWLEEHGFAE